MRLGSQSNLRAGDGLGLRRLHPFFFLVISRLGLGFPRSLRLASLLGRSLGCRDAALPLRGPLASASLASLASLRVLRPGRPPACSLRSHAALPRQWLGRCVWLARLPLVRFAALASCFLAFALRLLRFDSFGFFLRFVFSVYSGFFFSCLFFGDCFLLCRLLRCFFETDASIFRVSLTTGSIRGRPCKSAPFRQALIFIHRSAMLSLLGPPQLLPFRIAWARARTLFQSTKLRDCTLPNRPPVRPPAGALPRPAAGL